jgi:hypothetical protein
MSQEFVEPPDDAPEFVVDSAKGAIVDKNTAAGGTGGRSYNDDRTHEPPEEQIEENRLFYNTDPHVGQAVNITLDWLLADGYNISTRNIEGTDMAVESENLASLRKLIINSSFSQTFNQFIKRALVDGHAFLELVVEDETFKPRILPSERMSKFTDEYGVVQEYILEPPEGGGPTDNDATKYKPSDVAEFTFNKIPLEEFGRSPIERVRDQTDILRDMEIDYARFVASKAYPPILWKCGTENNQWSEDQISNWLDSVEEVEPDSVLGGPHDVEAEVVGTTSTSSSAGAMRLEETFKHHERRIVTGIGVPAVLANLDNKGGSAEVLMPAFKRRIKRHQGTIKAMVEEQIIKPLFVESVLGSSIEDFSGIVPEFKFGEHSSAEKRLELDKLIKLFNNGMLTREAFASRAGIDVETELPDEGQLTEEIIPLLQELASENAQTRLGDSIQNPDGGRPTDTGGGAQSSGREVTSRESGSSGETDDSDRPRQGVTEDTSSENG